MRNWCKIQWLEIGGGKGAKCHFLTCRTSGLLFRKMLKMKALKELQWSGQALLFPNGYVKNP